MLSYYLNSKEDIKDNSENFDNEIKDEKERFQLPIYYLENKYKLVDNIKSDLELIDLSSNSLYNNILSNQEIKSNKLINKWSEYYTTNKEFLLDTQVFLSKYSKISSRILLCR